MVFNRERQMMILYVHIIEESPTFRYVQTPYQGSFTFNLPYWPPVKYAIPNIPGLLIHTINT